MNEIPSNIVVGKDGPTNNANFRVTPLVYREIAQMYIQNAFFSSLLFGGFFIVAQPLKVIYTSLQLSVMPHRVFFKDTTKALQEKPKVLTLEVKKQIEFRVKVNQKEKS